MTKKCHEFDFRESSRRVYTWLAINAIGNAFIIGMALFKIFLS